MSSGYFSSSGFSIRITSFSPQLHVTITQQKRGLMVSGALGMHLFKLCCGVVNPAHLVIAKSQIQSGFNKGRGLPKSGLVFGDGFFKLTQAGESGAEV
jgi:hypothetical protein